MYVHDNEVDSKHRPPIKLKCMWEQVRKILSDNLFISNYLNTGLPYHSLIER